MSVSRAFLQHALDLLGPGGPVQARSMFGGFGLFHRGAMFALLGWIQRWVAPWYGRKVESGMEVF